MEGLREGEQGVIHEDQVGRTIEGRDGCTQSARYTWAGCRVMPKEGQAQGQRDKREREREREKCDAGIKVRERESKAEEEENADDDDDDEQRRGRATRWNRATDAIGEL
jgi:hypothetical protein